MVTPIEGLPRAAWVVAITGIFEYPLQYRAGFMRELSEEEVASFHHHLGERGCLSEAMIYRAADHPETPSAGMVALLDVNINQAMLYNQRAVLRELKEVVRPECPFTALMAVGLNKLAGNTGMAWVGIRDYISDADLAQIVRALEAERLVARATVRGKSTIELRADWRLFRRPDQQLTSLLVPHGIYPDLYMMSEAFTEFEETFKPSAGF